MTDTQTPGTQGGTVDLVLAASPTSCNSLVGALDYLVEKGYEPEFVAGVSGGALVGALLVAGYTPKELRDMVTGAAFQQLLRPSSAHLPSVSGLSVDGLEERDPLLRSVRGWLGTKGIRTFADLQAPASPRRRAARYRYRLVIIASDMTDRSRVTLPAEVGQFGVEPDRLEVALAVRMSMGIPLAFEPVRLPDAQTGRHHLIVDGRVYGGFPVNIFDARTRPTRPTFGIRTVSWGFAREREPSTRAQTADAREANLLNVSLDYFNGLVAALFNAYDGQYLEPIDFMRTINVPSQLLSEPTDEEELISFNLGRSFADAFVREFDWQKYLRRRSSVPSTVGESVSDVPA